MMRGWRITWLLLLLLTSCAQLQSDPSQASSATLPAAPTVDQRSLATHVIVAVQGSVQVRRATWKDDQFTPALFGTALGDNDHIRVAQNARATLICANLSAVQVLPTDVRPPCPAQEPVLTYKGVEIEVTRAIFDDYPVIIAPRKTMVMNPRPTVRWKPRASDPAAPHHISISAPGVSWQVTVTGVDELEYPDDQLPLPPGGPYLFVVESGGRSSSEEGVGLGFSVLDAQQAERIASTVERIQALTLDDAATRLLIAHTFASSQLFAEAIAQLEPLSPGQGAVERLLGDLYSSIELPLAAETHYLEALMAAQLAGDRDGEAWAQRQLGRIYLESYGNLDEGCSLLQAALDTYRRLGDETSTDELTTYLADMRC